MRTPLFLLPFFIASISLAQSVSPDLEDFQVVQVDSGIIVFGESGEKSDKKFVAIKYDNNLREIKRYAKPLEKGIRNIFLNQSYRPNPRGWKQVGNLNIEVSGSDYFEDPERNKTLFFQVTNNMTISDVSYIKLDDNLNEIAFLQSDTKNYQSLYDHPIFKKVYYTYEGPAFGNATYTTLWKNDLENKKIKRITTLLSNDTSVYIYVNYELAKKKLAQYIIGFNPKTLETIFKVQLNKEEENMFTPSSALIHENKLFVIGNYADLKKHKLHLDADYYYLDDGMDATFLAELDRNTGTIAKLKIENYKHYEFDGSNFFTVGLQEMDHPHLFMANDQIIALGVCHYARHTSPGTPVGYVKYKFNSTLEVLETKFYPKEKKDRIDGFYRGSLDGYQVDENENITFLYSNVIIHNSSNGGQNTFNPEETTYHVISAPKNGEYVYKVIPGQVDKKKDTKCFLRYSDSVFMYVPKTKESPAQVKIVRF